MYVTILLEKFIFGHILNISQSTYKSPSIYTRCELNIDILFMQCGLVNNFLIPLLVRQISTMFFFFLSIWNFSAQLLTYIKTFHFRKVIYILKSSKIQIVNFKHINVIVINLLCSHTHSHYPEHMFKIFNTNLLV